MSITAMKNKAFTLQSSHTDKEGVFSLNGKSRHPERTLGRLLYPTSMKGLDVKGYGGGSRCRLSGRFARKCGSAAAYPPQIHTTCEMVQTTVKHSVMNTSGKLSKELRCCENVVSRPPIKKTICDYVIADVATKKDKECNSCGVLNVNKKVGNYVKEVGAISYDTRLRKLKQCLDEGYVADTKNYFYGGCGGC